MLEGLEPVRRRPGMYIGGTDERALHHLAAEVLDNAMDEAVAGHANRIEVELRRRRLVTVSDNGRGIPVDPHPKFPDKSALEVILTTLHSGGKFGGKAYATSGGLHGVGVSVVNALSDQLKSRSRATSELWTPGLFAAASRSAKLKKLGPAPNRRGTTVSFTPDPEIFGEASAVQTGAALPDGAVQGLFVPRRRNPLALRSRTGASDEERRQRRCCISRRPVDFLAASSAARMPSPRPFVGQVELSGGAGPRRMGDGLAGGRRGFIIPIATPSRRPKAARMRPACARPDRARSRPMAN